MKKLLILLIILLSFPAFSNDLTVQMNIEIMELFDFIKTSHCRFNRNGRWYTSIEAAEHIDKKYQYAKKKGGIGSTEDFIKYSATKSSITGKLYKVECESGDLQNSVDWLTARLHYIREKKE